MQFAEDMERQAAASERAASKFPKGSGVNITIDWESMIAVMGQIMAFIGEGAYAVQIRAAEAVADRLREYLESGGDGSFDLLSKTPQILVGDRPPLFGLGKHVIVKKPKRARTAGGVNPQTGAGFPGVFKSTFEPAIITFEEGWEEIAFRLNKGYYIVPTKAQRRWFYGMLSRAEPSWRELLGKVGGVKGDVWLVPPRPFDHILSGPESESLAKEIAQQYFKGDITHDIVTARKISLGTKKFPKPVLLQRAQIDDLEQVMGDTRSSGPDFS